MSKHFSYEKDWENWCLENGYKNPYKWIDEYEYRPKRVVYISFYLEHENGTYGMFSCTNDYDWGNDNFTLEDEGLIRKEIPTVKIVYEKG